MSKEKGVYTVEGKKVTRLTEGHDPVVIDFEGVDDGFAFKQAAVQVYLNHKDKIVDGKLMVKDCMRKPPKLFEITDEDLRYWRVAQDRDATAASLSALVNERIDGKISKLARQARRQINLLRKAFQQVIE